MKKILAMAVLGAAVVGTVAMSSKVSAQTEPQVDEALVNAQIDARLHLVLGRILAERGPRN